MKTANAYPLIGRPGNEALACYQGRLVNGFELYKAALAFSEKLPPGVECLNLCQNRFHFMVVFCAVILAKGKNILPPNKQVETLHGIYKSRHNCKIVIDCDLVIPGVPGEAMVRLEIDAQGLNPGGDGDELSVNEPVFPLIPAWDVVAEVYTSGSTGEPQCLQKTWSALQGVCYKLGASFAELQQNSSSSSVSQVSAAESLSKASKPVHLVATVPCQHMYGLECSVLMPLYLPLIAHDATYFYPQDIIAQLSACEGETRLVTTPVHLRSVIDAGLRLPPQVSHLISATAPLDSDLAQRVEDNSDANVYEIFGFSEAGSIATRKTTAGPFWGLLAGITFKPGETVNTRLEHPSEGGDYTNTLQADHLPGEETLSDNIVVTNARTFKFVARARDHLNIGGKRMSLNDLLHKLLSLPGVKDAYLFVSDAKARPAGFIVAEQPVRDVLKCLSELVDPVFLPRPLKPLSYIPRNDTGKVTAVERDQMVKMIQVNESDS